MNKKNYMSRGFLVGCFGLCFNGGVFFSVFLKYLRKGIRKRGGLHCIFSYFTTQNFELFFFSLSFELLSFEGPFLPSLLHPTV